MHIHRKEGHFVPPIVCNPWRLKQILHINNEGMMKAKRFWPVKMVSCKAFPFKGSIPNETVTNRPHSANPNNTSIIWQISMNRFMSIEFLPSENEVATKIFFPDYWIFCKFFARASEKNPAFEEKVGPIGNAESLWSVMVCD